MNGYIGLFRCLLDKPIWKNSTPEQKVILITLLLMVNHEENEWEWKGQKYAAKPGQTITSIEKIVVASGKGITTQNVRSALARFKKLEFLTNESTKTGRLITIVNWELYQIEMMKGNKDTNIEVTKSQQRGNKEVTTNKKDNNDNKDKKDISSIEDSDEMKLAHYLFNWMKKNNAEAKEPNFNAWAKDFDKIIRIDNKKVADIKKIIEWCQKDTFWRKNILSPGKLRDKYDQLLLNMKDSKSSQQAASKKSSTFTDYNQRSYDFDELEKKLLGDD